MSLPHYSAACRGSNLTGANQPMPEKKQPIISASTAAHIAKQTNDVTDKCIPEIMKAISQAASRGEYDGTLALGYFVPQIGIDQLKSFGYDVIQTGTNDADARLKIGWRKIDTEIGPREWLVQKADGIFNTSKGLILGVNMPENGIDYNLLRNGDTIYHETKTYELTGFERMKLAFNCEQLSNNVLLMVKEKQS